MADFQVPEVNVNLGVEPIQAGLLESDEDRKKIVSYLTEEVNSVLDGVERERLVKTWRTWRRMSEARPEQATKDYPWPGASNITVPLTMTDTHGLYALLKASYGQKKPFFTVTSTSGDHAYAKVLTKALDAMAESRNHINLRQTNNTIFYDLIRLGTQFVKVPWVTDAYTFKRQGEGGTAESVTRIRRNSPTVIPIRIEDFLTRPYWTNIQTMPWVGHHVHKMEHELLQQMQQGIYDPDAVQTVLDASPRDFDESELEDMERRGIDPAGAYRETRSIVEAYMFWDVDGDGIPEDIKIWLHPETGAILRVEYNDLGVRDIVRIPYINLPGQLYAMGTGWICEPMQNEMDALHNMRIDATHISSLQMFATKAGGKLQGKIDFRPLKRLEFDDPSKDFQVIKFPGVGYESIQAEMLTREYANRATGASDYMMGFENKAIGTRSTLGGTEFLAAQGNKLFDAIAENVDEAEAEIGQILAFQLVRNREAALKSIMPLLEPDDRPMFEDILDVNVEDIPGLFNFRVTTTDTEKTEQVKMQQKMSLFQLYTNYGEKLFQLAPVIFSPSQQVPEPMRKMGMRFFVGATRLMEKIFKYFDEHDTDEYLPYVEDIDMMLDMLRQQKEAQVTNVRTNMSGVRSGGAGGQLNGGAGGQPGMEGPQGPDIPTGNGADNAPIG